MAYAQHNPPPPIARNLEELESFKALPPFAVALYLTDEELEALQAALDCGTEHESKGSLYLPFIQADLDRRPMPEAAARAMAAWPRIAERAKLDAEGTGLAAWVDATDRHDRERTDAYAAELRQDDAETGEDTERRHWSEA